MTEKKGLLVSQIDTHREKVDAIAQALYEFFPIVEQETDNVDGSPCSPPYQVPWQEVVDGYPATYEALIGMALTCAKYLEATADLPLNTQAGLAEPEHFVEGTEVVKFDLIASKGKLDEDAYQRYGEDGNLIDETWFASIVWEETGCVGELPINELVLVTEAKA